MRFASFNAEGRDRYGISPDGRRLYDLAALLPGAGVPAPRTLQALIEESPLVMPAVVRLLGEIERDPSGFPSHGVDDVRFLPPVTRPSKICCVALNNSANADRIMSGPRHPAMFVKPSNTLTGHRSDILLKRRYGRVHPEPELAVVIGREARDVTVGTAYDHVFGYTVHNDVTSPTMRTEDTFHYRAIHAKNGNADEIEYIDTWVSYPGRYKGCDTFSCMGPWLVTRDEIPDPHRLAVECRQDGKLITADNTANLFHTVPQVIEFLSGYMTLFAGDIISMGTALKASGGGGGAVQNIDLTRPGTSVSVSIEAIGTLENTSRMVD